MGLLDFIYAAGGGDLAPVSPPLMIHPSMVKDKPTTLLLKESMFSITGDDFAITDGETNETVLKCTGKLLSFHERKKLYDADGNLLFNMADKTLALGPVFVIKDGKGEDVLLIKKKKFTIGSKMVAGFQTARYMSKEIVLSGDMWGGSANIKLDDGTHLAHISRNLMNANEVVGDKQTYYLTIAPGVDIALMAVVCICFDEVKNESEDEEEKKEDD